MDYIEKLLERNKHIGIFILRIFIGLRLFYGVADNVISWEKMIEFSDFLALNKFPLPLISAVFSVYLQFFGSILILLGFRIRIASFILIINFLVALVFVHLRANDSIEAMTPALAMFVGCITLLFTGGDKISIDYHLQAKKSLSGNTPV